MILRALQSLVIAAALWLPIANPVFADPANPQPAGTATGNPALDKNIFYSSEPAAWNGQLPLVFVHGLNGEALDWWTNQPVQGQNDMYSLAYAAGYRTAFVSLNANGQRSPSNDMWVNGQTLASQLQAISRHYGVQQVDIVAHSKGGVDAQTAIIYYGAAPLVRNVFTLSSPFQGAELADLAIGLGQDTPDAQSLFSQLGISLDDAVRTLTPEYMEQFRAQTDPLVPQVAPNVHWYCAGGTDGGPTGSVLRITNSYLSQFGANDSMVTVASACVPYAKLLFVGPYHHFHMNVGHNAFPWIQAALRGGSAIGLDFPPVL